MKIMATGDRSMDENAAFLVFAELFSQVVLRHTLDPETGREDTLTLYTGDLPGFEAGVRFFCQQAGVPVVIIPTGFELEGASLPIDFDFRHQLALDSGVELVVFFHVDPLASSIGKSLARLLPDDRLVFVGS